MSNILKSRLKEFEIMANDIGLNYFPIEFEIVPQEVMLEVTTYALPSRARHWVYGQSYDYQKSTGEMGYSKIYEIIMNNNPSYAFLLETNDDTTNTMVMAHCIGHSFCFANNYLFENTDRKMVYHAAERAERIEEYIQRYGIDKVEHCMNMAFSMDRHIDWNKGVNRKRYTPPRKVTKQLIPGQFDDIINPNRKTSFTYIENENFPPSSEFDLLWFAINYGNLEDWQKDIFEIIRQESYYFYPQFSTKILNEGIASFIHADFMGSIKSISAEEHMDFCRIHERVVQPGGNPLNINPYFLGFSVLQNIRARWDDYKSAGESNISGMEKVIEVVKEEDDISLIKNYLTKDLVNEMNLFAYKYEKDKAGDTFLTIESRDPIDVAEYLTKDMHHYRSPLISVEKASALGIELKHQSFGKTLDLKNLEKVMGYMSDIFECQIDIETSDDQGNIVHHTYDEDGFSAQENDD
jgi:stage V sporulation protein R